MERGRADRVVVMGTRWTWNHAGRVWVSDEGWKLRYGYDAWVLTPPSETTTFVYQALNRHEAMVRAGMLIAEIERMG